MHSRVCMRPQEVDSVVLTRRDVGFVDLDEGVIPEALDVGPVVALPRLVAGILAELVFDRLEGRNFRRQALLDFQDVPSRLRRDRTDDRAARGVEDGFVEVGEELAARYFAEVAALVLAAGFGERLGELGEIAAAACLLGQVRRMLLRGLGGKGAVRTEDDDLAQFGALGKTVVLFLAVVALAELLVRQVFAGTELVAEDLVRD